ncbi:hypothetical protein [Nitrolancea hollandica]|uniref:Uncharacterized protein n=1 Tax=Nitrolancea hollandica Lb TaxID=1129897 RepID=I4EE59_9BACT|nr:hypothetical protein [Nitrolancea hollandica]CCF82971.1 hypothetical protein NITHO_1720011 [Nitrolancea hollandica Lb]
MPGSHDANVPLLIIAMGLIVLGWTVGILAVRDYLRKQEIKDQQFEEEFYRTHCRDCDAELDSETGQCPRCQQQEGITSPDLPQ